MARFVSLFSSSILSILILLGFHNSAEGIECYVCNSYYHPTCQTGSLGLDLHLQNCTSDPSDPNDQGQKEGNYTYTLCRKIVQTISTDFSPQLNFSDAEKSDRVIRTCGYEKTDSPEYSAYEPGDTGNVYTCYTDQCNKATPQLTQHWTSIIVLTCVYCLLTLYFQI